MVNETKEGAMLRTATAELRICERHLETLRFRMSCWTVLKTWSIGSISDSIGLDGFGAKACGGSQGFSTSMIG